MPLLTGELTIADLLAARNTSLAKFGNTDTITQVLTRDVAVHNAILAQELADFVEITSDRQRLLGASGNGTMSEADEFGRTPTQKPQLNGQVAFPLRKWQFNMAWTKDWFKHHTPADMAVMTINAEKAHTLKLRNRLANAMFGSSDFSFRDYTRDNITFNIRRFWNADNQPIPDGPNGEIFNPATHTHFTAVTPLTGAAVIALASNVQEHRVSPEIKIAFNPADETTVRGLTGFNQYIDPRFQLGTGTVPDLVRANIARLNNRAIGIIGQAEIWIKPWGLANYAVAYDVSASEKPLVMRVDEGVGGPNLTMIAEDDDHPIHLRYMEDYFDFAAYGRGGAAVLYFGGGAYVDPTPLAG